MQMVLIRFRDRFLIEKTSHDRKECIGQRNTQNHDRCQQGENDGYFEPEYRKCSQGKTEEQGSRISHKNLGRMKVVEQKSGNASKKYRTKQDYGKSIAERCQQRKNQNGTRTDSGYTGGQTIQTVDQVHRVGNPDDPENGQRHAHVIGQGEMSSERDVEFINLKPACHYDTGRNELPEKLPSGRKLETVIQSAGEYNNKSSEHQCQRRVSVNIGQGRRDDKVCSDKSQENRYSTHTRHDSRMYLTVIRFINGAYPEGKTFDQRGQQQCKQAGYNKAQHI